jgi:hypothetical protein
MKINAFEGGGGLPWPWNKRAMCLHVLVATGPRLRHMGTIEGERDMAFLLAKDMVLHKCVRRRMNKSHSDDSGSDRFGVRGWVAMVDFDYWLLTLDHLRHDTVIAAVDYILCMICWDTKIVYNGERKSFWCDE